MIAEQYIKEGIRIRKIYMYNIKEILKQEPHILEKKAIFDKLRDEMDVVVKSDLNEIRKSLELDKKMLFLEKEIKSIQEIIRPYYEVIEKLQEDRDRLYLAIKEKYPKISTKQIEYEIMSRVEE